MLNGASPHLPHQGSNAGKQKKIKTLPLLKIFKANVTDQLYQAEHGVGKRKVGGKTFWRSVGGR